MLCGVITAVEVNNSDGCIPEIPSTGQSSHFSFHIKPGGGANGYGPISLTRWLNFPLLLQFSSTACGSGTDSVSASGVDSVVLILLCTGSGVVSDGSIFSLFSFGAVN